MIYVIGIIILAIIFFQIIPRIGNKLNDLEDASDERRRVKAEKLGITSEELQKRRDKRFFVILLILPLILLWLLVSPN